MSVPTSAWRLPLRTSVCTARLQRAHFHLECLAVLGAGIEQLKFAVATESDLVAVAVDVREGEGIGGKSI